MLHCNGNLTEMSQVADAVQELAGDAARRANDALALRKAPEEFDVEAARRIFVETITQRNRVS